MPANLRIESIARDLICTNTPATNVACLRKLWSLDLSAAGFARLLGGDVTSGQGAMSDVTYADVRAVQNEVEELHARRAMRADPLA